jgi:putative chitinase
VIPLTVAQVVRASGARAAEAEKFLPFLQGTCKAYDITSPRRISGFLSQIGHESAGFSVLTENLNYSTEALLRMFGRHRITEDQAKQHGRRVGQSANPEALANILYGGDWGRKNLGNTQPGDGWLYRGRGLKQLTGRDNYRRCGIALAEDFITNPDRLLLPVNAALSAGWFWSINGLNAAADRGDVHTMTKLVNGGVNGLDKRAVLYAQGMEVFA